MRTILLVLFVILYSWTVVVDSETRKNNPSDIGKRFFFIYPAVACVIELGIVVIGILLWLIMPVVISFLVDAVTLGKVSYSETLYNINQFIGR